MKIIKILSLLALTVFSCSCTPAASEVKESKIHYDMGMLYLQEGDSIRALTEFVKAKDENPDDKHTWLALGLAYKERRLFKEAEDAFKRALALDNMFSEAHNNLGVLYLGQMKYKEAIPCFESATKNIFYTTPEIAFNNMGYAYQMLKEDAIAERHYIDAISLNPSFAPAYINLAKLYAQQKRVIDAEKVLKKMLTIYENDLEGNLEIGKLYYEGGRREWAKPYFEKVLKLDPRGPHGTNAKGYLGTYK